MWANIIAGIGGVLILLGLRMAFYSNRELAKAILAQGVGRGIYGEPIDSGWFTRMMGVKDSDKYFGIGVKLTILGIFLQTVGGLFH